MMAYNQKNERRKISVLSNQGKLGKYADMAEKIEIKNTIVQTKWRTNEHIFIQTLHNKTKYKTQQKLPN